MNINRNIIGKALIFGSLLLSLCTVAYTTPTTGEETIATTTPCYTTPCSPESTPWDNGSSSSVTPPSQTN